MSVLQEQIDQIKYLSDLVEQQKAAVKAASDKLKPAFIEYIKDRTVDLNTRWDFWLAAPVEMKQTGGWVEHLNFDGDEISWFDGPLYKERGSIVSMPDLIEILEDYAGYEPEKYPQEAIEQLKEDILEQNLHDFTNDW